MLEYASRDIVSQQKSLYIISYLDTQTIINQDSLH